MFNTKKDRNIINVTIRLNLSNIFKWIRSGSDINKINNLASDSELDDLFKFYIIDMIPIGQVSNAYFHRSKNLVSRSISGTDFLTKADEDLRINSKEEGLEEISWSFNKDYFFIALKINGKKKIIFQTVPLLEVEELEKYGVIKNISNLQREKGVKLRVLDDLNENSQFKGGMEIEKNYYLLGNSGVSYKNGLASVDFSIPIFDTEY